MGLLPLSRVCAATYYAGSAITLLLQTSFWRLPLLLVRKPVRISTRGGMSFYVMSPFDVWLMKEVVLDRDYVKWRPLRATDVVVDIGAGIGDFSVLAAKTARQVYAFEASAERIALARRNIGLNNCSMIQLQQRRVTSLEEVLDGNNISRCDFLKIDCEGCEYAVLGGASMATLQKVGYIALEAHLLTPLMREQYKALKKHLRAAGFKLREVANPVHGYLRFLFASH